MPCRSLASPLRLQAEWRKTSVGTLQVAWRKSSGESLQAEWRKSSGGSLQAEWRKSSGESLQAEWREPSGGSMQAEWREPSGESCERNGASHPVGHCKRNGASHPVGRVSPSPGRLRGTAIIQPLCFKIPPTSLCELYLNTHGSHLGNPSSEDQQALIALRTERSQAHRSSSLRGILVGMPTRSR